MRPSDGGEAVGLREHLLLGSSGIHLCSQMTQSHGVDTVDDNDNGCKQEQRRDDDIRKLHRSAAMCLGEQLHSEPAVGLFPLRELRAGAWEGWTDPRVGSDFHNQCRVTGDTWFFVEPSGLYRWSAVAPSTGAGGGIPACQACDQKLLLSIQAVLPQKSPT